LPFDGPHAPAVVRRVFLGWDGPVLHAAARWIRAELGNALGDVLVALPGARAARRLRELLAESAPANWTPPRVLTQGELVDELVEVERPLAGRLARTLVWEQALESLAADERHVLQRPRDGSVGERLRLAETVRTLHGELAPEGLDFARVAASEWPQALDGEAERWRILARVQDRYRALLAELGLADPHEGRARAIVQGWLDHERRIVLVGVADMNHLLAKALATLAERVHVLVAAPESLADGFDGLGRLRAAFWREREVPLALTAWRVAEKPLDQAELARAALEEWRGELATEDLTLGIGDESVIPYLERQMAECGATTRRAGGTALERTRPYRLLKALARYLRRGGFTELAALARDPDLGALLSGEGDPAAHFDAYFQDHLPRHAGDWLGARANDHAVRRFHERLEASLGERPAKQPLAAWAAPIGAWLARVYTRPLTEENETERVLAEALAHIGAALAELAEVPVTLASGTVSAADALELLLRALATQRIAPSERSEPGSVELVGWLDLALDDAPALILTGFNEGKIPQSLAGHAFLPDAQRARLGLASDAERVARDVYAAHAILATRARCVFVSGRRSSEGDPLVPSRLAFHAPERELPERVLHATPHAESPAARADDDALGTNFACPLDETAKGPTRLRVSAFKSYLASPYTFYLEQVLELKTLDDRTSELDPRRFGTFAHAVLQEFGERGPAASGDAEEVAEYLEQALRRRAAAEFGHTPLPAVILQLEQLAYRLRAFAAHQAARVREGWRIHAIEWKTPTPALLDVDGKPIEITARLDRVDRHPDGRWAILDYKTGEGKKNPREAHRRRDGTWIDLQLPLYHFVGRGLGFSGEPELGYAWIGKDVADTGFFVDPWSADELAEALEVARDVVRRVRAGEFKTVGRLPYEEILKALCGQSTLGVEEEPA
jgi:hypothetical protein